MLEKQLCRHQDQWRSRERRCFRYQTTDSPAVLGVEHSDADGSAEAHGSLQWSRYSCSLQRTTCQRICPEGSSNLWRAHLGSCSWQKLQLVEWGSWRQRFSVTLSGTHTGERGKHEEEGTERGDVRAWPQTSFFSPLHH